MSIFSKLFGRSDELQVVDAVSNVPRAGRRAARNPVQSRGYTAGVDKAYYGSFSSSSGSADYELADSLPKMRDKIRAIARNSSFGKRYLRLMRDNIVGKKGFKLSVRVRKMDKKLDMTLNTKVEKAFKKFMQRPTVDGKMSGNQLQKLAVTTWARDGEVFIEFVNGSNYADGFKVNVIEGDLVDTTLTTTHPTTGNNIRLGVEINREGVIVAYHFLHQHPGDMSWVVPASNTRYRRVPASKIIHVYECLRPGQSRGEPNASSTPNIINMVDGYREAEVTSRRVKASAMGIITETDNSSADVDLIGMADREDTVDEAFEMDVAPGTFKKLPRGLDLTMFDPGGTQSDFAEFEGQLKTDVSMGVNISPVSLGYETAKLSLSTHRGIVGEDREYYENIQTLFIEDFMDLLFVEWLNNHSSFNPTSEILPSRVQAIIDSFEFTGRGWSQFDPLKDVKADNEAMNSRSKSLSQVVLKQGRSLEDHLIEIHQDEELLKQYGLTQDFGGANSVETKPSSGGKNAKDEEDDDEE